MIKVKILFIVGVIMWGVVFSQEITAPIKGSVKKVKPTQDSASKERISLDLKGVNIADLLRVISLKTQTTIVPSKETTGRVNIFLNSVTFQDVLDIITVSQGLALEKKNDIYYVMTLAEYRALFGKNYAENREVKTVKFKFAQPESVLAALNELKSEIGKVIIDKATRTAILIDIAEKTKDMEKAIADLDVALVTEVFDLNYAEPAQVKTILTAAVTPGVGEVVVDEQSRKVIVTDAPARLEKIRKIIQAIDEESRQVYIEAEIVQVTLNKKYYQGIEWQAVFSKISDLDFVGNFPATIPVAAYKKITVGTLDDDKYTATVNLLQTFGDTKVLSRPQIAVVNNQEAKIMVGSKEAYVTSTLSQAQTTTVTSESIQFVDVGVKLRVTPNINSQNFITLKIKPEISSVKSTLTTSGGSVVPIIETSEAETTVKIKDGKMVMIGGLIRQGKTNDHTGVPLLSKIPLFGELFKSKALAEENTELVIFITPHITRGDVGLTQAQVEKYVPAEIMATERKQKVVATEVDKIPFKKLDSNTSEDVIVKEENIDQMKKIKEY